MSVKSTGLGRWYVIAAPYLWLLIFFLIPFFIVFKLSLSDVATAIPPYTPDLSPPPPRISGPNRAPHPRRRILPYNAPILARRRGVYR